MCMNYSETDKNTKITLLEVDYDFPEICPSLKILEIVSLIIEDNVN